MAMGTKRARQKQEELFYARTLRLAVDRGEIEAEHPLSDGPWIFRKRVLESEAANAGCLLTLSTKVVDVCCHGTVCIHGKVKILVNQEVIARTLPNYLEIVHQCFGERKSSHIGLEAKPCDACGLVFVPTHRTHTA